LEGSDFCRAGEDHDLPQATPTDLHRSTSRREHGARATAAVPGRPRLEDYQEVAGPRGRVADIAREINRQHPERALPMVLWLTRGLSLGLVGPKELWVPPETFGG
jgi:hypothetical protein